MKLRKYIAFALLLGFSVQGYAQKSDEGWMKRNWNNMIARYNIYFNATQKLDAAVNNLAEKQKDDFEKYLNVYPYGSETDIKAMKTPMEEVMKKASKVIQNKPKSKWADDAYFIIGQTHFYAGDYFSAIETFEFVNANFTDPYIKEMSQLWLMKSYAMQGKDNDAEAILGLLKNIKTTNKEFTTHLALSAGDLMVKQGKYPEAIEYLTKGVSKVKDKTLKYRANFVLGQLYLETEKYTDASYRFEKVLKMNAPYEYVFQANLGMAKATSQTGGQGAKSTKKYLKRMLNDDKNIEYYDQIYYELASIEFASGNEQTGLEYMMLSSKNAKNNRTQSTKTYLYLADYFFGKRSYTKAQAYYDSTVAVLPGDFPNGDKIKAKHSVLSKLIEHIETIKLQDSLLALSRMDKDALDKKITKIIEEEKEKERLAEEAALIQAEQQRLNPNGGMPQLPNGNNSTSTWYFYNTSAVARGSNDFVRTWGNRKKGDWWRVINKSVVESAVAKKDNSEEDEDDELDATAYNSSADEEQNKILRTLDAEKLKYYKPIPFSAMAKLVAEKKIQDAYLGIGKIYYEDLREYAKSKTNFVTLLTKYPLTKHKPEAIFYLAKAERELGDSNAYDKYAKQIAEEYPESAYNQVLNATEIVEDSKDKEVVELYGKMYGAYESEKFAEVVAMKEQIDREYPGNSIQGKIDYLYALTIGKTKGKAAFLVELEALKEAYSGNEIGDIAAYTITLLTSTDSALNSEASIYKANSDEIHYYMVTGITKNEKNVQVQLDEYNKSFFSGQTLIISGLLMDDKQVFYVKQFPSKKEALVYHKEMLSNKTLLSNAGMADIETYAISESNFRTLIKTKNEKEYIRFFRKNYK